MEFQSNETQDRAATRKWIVISGAHSSGKTTLLEEVKRRNPQLQMVNELARIVLHEKKWTSADIDPDAFPENFHALSTEIIDREAQELDELDPSKNALIDRGLDALGYIKLFSGPDRYQAVLLASTTQKLINMIKKKCHVVIIEPQECLIKADSLRLPSTYNEMLEFHETLIGIHSSLGIPYTLITSLDLMTRVKIIEDMLQ